MISPTEALQIGIMEIRNGGRISGKEIMRITRANLNAYRKAKKWTKKIDKWIDQIEDPEARCVIDLYYRQGHTWRQIAAETGGIYDEHYLRIMIRDRYFKKRGIDR